MTSTPHDPASEGRSPDSAQPSGRFEPEHDEHERHADRPPTGPIPTPGDIASQVHTRRFDEFGRDLSGAANGRSPGADSLGETEVPHGSIPTKPSAGAPEQP